MMLNDQETFDKRCMRTLQEIDDADYTNLIYESIAPVDDWRGNAELVFAELTESEDLQLDSSFRNSFFRPDEIHAEWRSTTGPLIVGEFCLNHIYECFTRSTLPPDDKTLRTNEREILGDLYVIDTAPRGGTGNIAGLYESEDSGFDVWFYDMGLHRLERLDLDYAGYLDAILVTKGVAGWQYLFADCDMSSAELHSIAVDLEVMLNTFPEVFPRHDYYPLRARLEARL
jgi:hypothetical protein